MSYSNFQEILLNFFDKTAYTTGFRFNFTVDGDAENKYCAMLVLQTPYSQRSKTEEYSLIVDGALINLEATTYQIGILSRFALIDLVECFIMSGVMIPDRLDSLEFNSIS